MDGCCHIPWAELAACHGGRGGVDVGGTTKRMFCVIAFFVLGLVLLGTERVSLAKSNFENITQRWSKTQTFTDDLGATLDITVTYYSGEYIGAVVQQEAEKNLWTNDETENYKYNFLKNLRLDETIPIQITFNNNGPTMHMAPFDGMVTLRIGNKVYKPVDYDKRFNFKLQGKIDGLVYFPRYDEKTGKSLLDSVKTVQLEFASGISSVTEGKRVRFLWDVDRDNPEKLYAGKAASQLEIDRLLKRTERLNAEKVDLEGKLKAIYEELLTIQKRIDELQKQQQQ
jgi:hypothetical protein